MLYKQAAAREEDRIKIEAKLHGIDVDKAIAKAKKDNIMTFRDPKDYENMSDDKKQELTDKMMGVHKSWVKGKAPGMGPGESK